MGVRSVSGHELMARAASSATLTPRPKGDFEAKPTKAPQTVRARSEPGETRPAAEAVSTAREAHQPAGVNLRFDGRTERIVAQIVNELNEVIKQIPPEELLKVVAKTRQLRGLLFDQEA